MESNLQDNRTDQLAAALLLLEEHWNGSAEETLDEVLDRCPSSFREQIQHDGLYSQVDAGFAALRQFVREMPPREILNGKLPQIPGFEVLGELDRGGMGIVYRARQTSVGRIVAIKMIAAGPFASPRLRERFLKEAESIGSLHHPNIVQIHGAGEHNGIPFLVLEYVDGGSLAANAGGVPVAPRQAAQWIEQIAVAMHYAHERGIVHRDLKPSNILVRRDGAIKVSDFGLAKNLDDDRALTRSGENPGTLCYMAPELLAGGGASPATDVYAMGAVLYELLTGRTPFVGDSNMATMMMVRTSEPVPIRRQAGLEVPPDLEAICLKCLEKDPRRRYASAAHLAADLVRFRTGQPTLARPLRGFQHAWRWCRQHRLATLLIGIACVTALLALGGIWWHNRSIAAELMRSERLRGEANHARRLAESRQLELQRQVYATRIRLAQLSWQQLRNRQYRDLLDRAAGESAAPRRFEWSYLDLLSKRGRIALAPQDPSIVDGVAVSPDGQSAATANRNGTIDLWDTTDGTRRAHFRAHEQCANLVEFSPDGLQLVTASCDSRVRFWDPRDQQLLDEWHCPGGAVHSVAWSPDGQTLYVASDDHIARAWNREQRQVVEFISPDDRPQQCVALSPDGRWLATGGAGYAVNLWDTGQVRLIHRFQDREAGTLALAFSADSQAIAISNAGNVVRLISLVDFREIHYWNQHDVYALASDPRGGRLFAGDSSGSIHVLETGDQFDRSAIIVHNERVDALSVFPDGERLASASFDRSAMILDVGAQGPYQRVEIDWNQALGVAVNPRQGSFAVARRDGNVWLYDIEPDSTPLVLERQADWSPSEMRFSRDGSYLLLEHQNPPPAEIWRIDSQAPRQITSSAGSPAAPAAQHRAGPHEMYRIEAAPEQPLRIVERGTGKVFRELPLDVPGLAGVEFGPLPTWLCLTDKQKLTLHDFAIPAPVATIHTTDRIQQWAVSPDGHLVATATQSGLHLWRVETQQLVANLVGHAAPVTAVCFSPDGQRVASGDQEGELRVWRVGDERALLVLEGHERAICNVAFSQDGQILLSYATNGPPIDPGRQCSDEGELFLWRGR